MVTAWVTFNLPLGPGVGVFYEPPAITAPATPDSGILGDPAPAQAAAR